MVICFQDNNIEAILGEKKTPMQHNASFHGIFSVDNLWYFP